MGESMLSNPPIPGVLISRHFLRVNTCLAYCLNSVLNMKVLFLGAFNQPGEGALSKKSLRTFVWSSSNFARFAWQLQKRHAARASWSYSSGAGAPCQKTCQSGRWGARACTAVLLLCSLWQCRLSTFIHSKSDISPYRWGYRLEYSQILKPCVSIQVKGCCRPQKHEPDVLWQMWSW